MTQLTKQEIQERKNLTTKLAHKTINSDEANTLKKLLEKEKKTATQNNDWEALVAIGGLLLFLYIILKK